ncbi:hypothetical protein MKX01_009936, partial [Papaver californicum]
MEEVKEGKDFSFPKQEEKIRKYWSDIQNSYSTMVHHLQLVYHTGTIKDTVTRYQTMIGHHIARRFGWDCHGIKTRQDVLNLGIADYNEECRSIVTRYVSEWENTVTRMGRWIDFQNDYKTMDVNFMESVWWVFCHIDVSDPEIMVSFPIIGDPHNAALVAWTTTPWTLPSNLCLCVNAKFGYVKVRNKTSGCVYVVAKCRLSQLPSDTKKKKSKADNAKSKNKSSSNGKVDKEADPGPYEVLETMTGASLVGLKIVADDYVTDDSGTGVVHCAPAFGEEDYRLYIANQVIQKGEDLI